MRRVGVLWIHMWDMCTHIKIYRYTKRCVRTCTYHTQLHTYTQKYTHTHTQEVARLEATVARLQHGDIHTHITQISNDNDDEDGQHNNEEDGQHNGGTHEKHMHTTHNASAAAASRGMADEAAPQQEEGDRVAVGSST